MKKKQKTKAGLEKTNEPRHIKEILKIYFEKSNEPLAVAYRDRLFKDIHPNTELGIDLKLLTRKPGRMKQGEKLNGCLTRDGESHYLFFQNAEQEKSVTRNPRVFDGEYITMTLDKDGNLRPNFKIKKLKVCDNIEAYAFGVANELIIALKGLVE